MAKVQSVEPNIADLANGWLKSYRLPYKLEQESLNTEIDQALNDYASKSGGAGGNRPDAKLLLQDKNLVNYPILIEYKGYKDKLVMLDADGRVANKTSKNLPDFKTINSYAVNGAVHYANALLHYKSYTDIRKARNTSATRRASWETTLKELRSLNRSMECGELRCMDCNSTNISFSASKKNAYAFDVSTIEMRNEIIASINEKIDSYNEEISKLSAQINRLQFVFGDNVRKTVAFKIFLNIGHQRFASVWLRPDGGADFKLNLAVPIAVPEIDTFVPVVSLCRNNLCLGISSHQVFDGFQFALYLLIRHSFIRNERQINIFRKTFNGTGVAFAQ